MQSWQTELFKLFAVKWTESLNWGLYDDNNGGKELQYHVDCSDTFDYGSADLEKVNESDIPALRQAKSDLPEGNWPLLWVARKRNLRPMNAYMKQHVRNPLERQLLEQAGPERKSDLLAP